MSARQEWLRKLLHLAMGFPALLLRWLTPGQMALLLFAALLFNVAVLQRWNKGSLLRADELRRGYSLGIVLYPAVLLALVAVFRERVEIVAGAWAILAFGDGMATVTGKLLGGPRLAWNPRKTWAGFLAFVLYGASTAAFSIRFTQQAVVEPTAGTPTWIGGSFLTGAPWLLLAACAVAATLAAFAESAGTGVDDNAVVPLVASGALWTATFVEPALLAAASRTLVAGIAVGAAVNALLAAAAFAARGVSASGAWSGWLAGTLLYGFTGWRGFGMLVLFFVLGTACTKLGWTFKASRGIAQEQGGRRGARHVVANGSVGLAFAFLSVATPHRGVMLAGMVAAFATAAADTVATEVGQVHGRRHRLLTTLRSVPAGTRGAVSVEGTLAGIAAALLMGGAAWMLGLVPFAGVAVVAGGATAGSLLESLAGAAFPASGGPSHGTLNLANTLVGGSIAAAVTAALL